MTQKQALRTITKGFNVFLTGPPGSGKSYVLDCLIKSKYGQKKKLAICATTGIAASLIGGVTINSWSGVGVMSYPKERILSILSNNSYIVRRYIDTELLIIDEISMMDIELFETIDYLARKLRDTDIPFGGIQIVLCGDFFQLPPIQASRISNYLFETNTWQDLALKICYLSEQHRQENDSLFEVLMALRERRFNKTYLDLLMDRRMTVEEDILHLVTHNLAADQINLKHLEALPSELTEFNIEYFGDPSLGKQRLRSLLIKLLIT